MILQNDFRNDCNHSDDTQEEEEEDTTAVTATAAAAGEAAGEAASAPGNMDNVSLLLDDPATTAQRRLYKVRLPRTMGIDWKTDLSFRFVSVRQLDPTGAARRSGLIQVGDQLCEVTPVAMDMDDTSTSTSPTPAVAVPVNLVGASFDTVMQTFMELDRNVVDVDLVFFRGSKEELLACAAAKARGTTTSTSTTSQDSDTVSITVVQNTHNNKGAAREKDKIQRTLVAPVGVNLRQVLVQNKIQVYQNVARFTNCKGKQLCGTCIVNVMDTTDNAVDSKSRSSGGVATKTNVRCNRKSIDEASTLRENPDSYRLSCVTFVYGDITVETFPSIKATQWTR